MLRGRHVRMWPKWHRWTLEVKMSEENKAVARRFFEEVHSQGKVELVEELMAADYIAKGAGPYCRRSRSSQEVYLK